MDPILSKKYDVFFFVSFLICGTFMCISEHKFSIADFIVGFVLMFPTLVISFVITFVGLGTNFFKIVPNENEEILDEKTIETTKQQTKIIRLNYFSIVCIPVSILVGILYVIFN